MLALKKQIMLDDFEYHLKDTRLTEPSDGKRFQWREMIKEVENLGRPLTEKEIKKFEIK